MSTEVCQRCNGDGEEYVNLHPVRCGGCSGDGRVEVKHDSPLCAEVATIPIEDILRLIETGRAVGFDETADRVEKWLQTEVGNSIPF